MNDCLEKVVKESKRLEESLKRKDKRRRKLEEQKRQNHPNWSMDIDTFLDAKELQKKLNKEISTLEFKLLMERKQFDMLQDIISDTNLWEEELNGSSE